MLDIGNKLREARQQKKLSLRELASRAEVSASLLSQIENDRANPSVNTLYRIAEALSVSVDYFFTSEEEPGDPSVEKTASEMRMLHMEQDAEVLDEHFEPGPHQMAGPVVHHNSRPSIALMGGVTWSRLTHEAEPEAEFLEIIYEPGATSGTKSSHHAGREFGMILEGTLILELGFEQYQMNPGDSIIFDSTTPHRLTNPSQQRVRAIWIVLAPE